MAVFNYPEFGWHVCEVSPQGKVVEYIAVSSNFTAARAAYLAILPERVGRHIQLTCRSRVILDSREDQV
jgi:hypothetical protein